MAEITEEELLVQKEAIKLFNDSVNGKVNSMELGRLLKSLGYYFKPRQYLVIRFLTQE